ncbi:MAG TPA: hypothetical protein VFQ44_09570 [Streptosporangiaceae bacterium]|nr:hypothetical protein [Streptosporangiaceae bacterium]
MLRPTSCNVSHRSIQSLTVILAAPGSIQWPWRILASWSRPQARADALVLNPGSLPSPPLGSLYLTRHGVAPLPRFSAYAIYAPVPGTAIAPLASDAGPAGEDFAGLALLIARRSWGGAW